MKEVFSEEVYQKIKKEISNLQNNHDGQKKELNLKIEKKEKKLKNKLEEKVSKYSKRITELKEKKLKKFSNKERQLNSLKILNLEKNAALKKVEENINNLYKRLKKEIKENI